VPVTVSGGGNGFRISFRNGPKDPTRLGKNTDLRLMENVEFKVTWVNRYNVSATRTFLIQVIQDQPPAVEVAVDVIRRQGNVYLVTPAAKIPFNPDSFIKDDHGLSKVEYTFTYWAEDSDLVRGLRAKYALRSLLDVPLPGGGPANLLPRVHADNFRFLDKADDRRTGSVLVSEFENQRHKIVPKTRAQLEALLGSTKGEGAAPETVKKVELKNPSRDFFDLKELHDLKLLKIAVPRGEVQTVYRMDLNIQATDNNVDSPTGPVVSTNAEPIRLRIVAESDLLDEISKEELQLATRLEEAIAKIAAARSKYKFVVDNNGYRDETPEQVEQIAVRARDAFQDVDKAREIVQSVGREFQRLARECEINRVEAVTQERYNKYPKNYDLILSDAPTPGNIPPIPVTFPMTQALLTNVQNPLNSGRWAPLVATTDASNAMRLLEETVIELRKLHGVGETIDLLRKEARKIKEDQARIGKQTDDWRRRVEDETHKKHPTIRETGVLTFAKGETKRLSHTIDWNQYDGDTIVVKLTPSDPSIMVPAELTLDFEKNTLRFDYPVKAGNKEGTFKITLTPAKGPPVEVQLLVK
jgi:hypothetical protein